MYKMFRNDFDEACYNGDIEKINQIINNGGYIDLSGIEYACRNGHINIVKLCIKKIEIDEYTWNIALAEAFLYKQTHIIHVIVDFLHKHNYNIHNWIIDSACQSKDVNMVQLFLQLKTQSKPFNQNELNGAMSAAGCSGNVDIIKLFIEKGYKLDWNWGFFGACSGGNINMIKFITLKSKEENVELDWNQGLHYACVGGNLFAHDFVQTFVHPKYIDVINLITERIPLLDKHFDFFKKLKVFILKKIIPNDLILNIINYF